MERARITTTVDRDLLESARRLGTSKNDGELVDAALRALVVQHRHGEVDDEYVAAYALRPLSTRDEWGDLESFRRAASQT